MTGNLLPDLHSRELGSSEYKSEGKVLHVGSAGRSEKVPGVRDSIGVGRGAWLTMLAGLGAWVLCSCAWREGVHWGEPVESLKAPDGQSWQVEPAGENWPVGHFWQAAGDAEPGAEVVPGGHGLHAVLSRSALNVPAGHRLQLVSDGFCR